MTGLTGTAALTRFVLRRNRLRILIWIGSIVLVELLTAQSTKGLFPTQEALDKYAAATHGDAAQIALNGPDQGLDTMGGQIAFQIGTTGLIAVALMALFFVGREIRGEEETGRLELLRAMAVGRHAPTAACLSVVAAMSAVVGGAIALGLIGLDLPAAGSLLFGASLFAEGLVFAGITIFAAQITENARVVFGSAGLVLGAAYVVRVVGDIDSGTVTWLSPIGWSQKTRPFAGDRWWPLIVTAAVTVSLVALGGALSTRRDMDAGLVPTRPGPRVASASLGRPLGLALRLQRASLIGWSIGIFVFGASWGWVASDVEGLYASNDAVRKFLSRLGGPSLIDAYLSAVAFLMALTATGFAIQSVLRMRTEETALRAEPLLATPLSRRGWVTSHLTVALAGSALVLAAAGLGTGLTYGIDRGMSQVPRLLGVALVYTPALWLFVGVATLLFGLVPRASTIVWAVFAACLVIGLLGEVIRFPGWITASSPFQHIPQLPAQHLTLLPLAVLTATASALVGAGLVAFQKRDLG